MKDHPVSKSQKEVSLVLTVFILLSMTACLSNAQPSSVQQPPTAPGTPTTIPPPVTLSADTQSLTQEVAVLREKVDNLSQTINLLFVALAAILALGGLPSLFSFIRTEARTQEAHKLGMVGERASQERAAEVHETFLGGSKNTLDLVNATLSLAKEASERAAKVIEIKARATLDELDNSSKSLILSVSSQQDRALVEDPARRSTLRSLAQKINGFEINRFMLPTDLQLTPACLFIRGMDFHLSQQFDDAFECWESVALRENTPSALRSLAWYWIGYEHNNVGRFADARLSFERALETAIGARRFELQRILIESRFFNKSKEPAETLIAPFEELLQSINNEARGEEVEERKVRILTTLGNVFHQVGNELRQSKRLEDARERYKKAREHFETAISITRDKWALFGLAETLYQLGENDKAETIFRNEVRTKAIAEYISREEPRTKVLARTTELICCLRVTSLNGEVAGINSQVVEALGRVDERLTVYSLIQRRNVTKAEFRKDLDELLTEKWEGAG